MSTRKPLKIAIADNEPEVRQYFAEALSESGYEVVVIASDGHELVKKCRIARPDLLITDISMDGLSGIEAMRLLIVEKPLPTILISAHCRPSDSASNLKEMLDENVFAFLPKPVKLADLIEAVDTAATKIS